MNWKLIARNWELIRPCIHSHWPALTDQDLAYVDGDRRRLVRALRERYRLTEAAAEYMLQEFEDPDMANADLHEPQRKRA